MKIIIDADDRAGAAAGEAGHTIKMTFTEIGENAWVRIEVGGNSYDVDYRDFWDAARAICIDQL